MRSVASSGESDTGQSPFCSHAPLVTMLEALLPQRTPLVWRNLSLGSKCAPEEHSQEAEGQHCVEKRPARGWGFLRHEEEGLVMGMMLRLKVGIRFTMLRSFLNLVISI